MNYKKMAFISGLVIFVSFVVLMVSVITLAGKRIFFTRDYIIYAKFDDVIGLQDQAKVFMRGYRIGWTKDVQFVDDGVVVRIDINKRFSIPKDSRFEINTISLLGEKAITIYPGNSPEKLKQGDMVFGENKDIIVELKTILNKFGKELDEGEISTRIKDISQSIVLLRNVLEDVEKQVEKFKMDTLNQAIAGIRESTHRFNRFMTDNEKNLNKMAARIPATLQRIDSLAGELQAIAKKINQGEGSAGLIVNNKQYIQRIDSTLAEINALVKDFKKNPKKYLDLKVF